MDQLPAGGVAKILKRELKAIKWIAEKVIINKYSPLNKHLRK